MLRSLIIIFKVEKGRHFYSPTRSSPKGQLDYNSCPKLLVQIRWQNKYVQVGRAPDVAGTVSQPLRSPYGGMTIGYPMNGNLLRQACCRLVGR